MALAIDIRLVTKSVPSMTEQEIAAARKQTLGGAGMMRGELNRRRRANDHSAKAVMAFHGDKLVGWALKFNKAVGRPHLYMYVNPKYRGQGIGRAIAGRSLVGQRKPLHVYPTPTARPVYARYHKRDRVKYVPGYWNSY